MGMPCVHFAYLTFTLIENFTPFTVMLIFALPFLSPLIFTVSAVFLEVTFATFFFDDFHSLTVPFSTVSVSVLPAFNEIFAPSLKEAAVCEAGVPDGTGVPDCPVMSCGSDGLDEAATFRAIFR